MTLRSILDALRSVPTRWRHRGRPAAFRPRLEPLDGRVLPSFTPLASYDAGASAVIAADFNNDDVADLALNWGQVVLGHGDGTFDSPADPGVGGDSIAVGDLDGDGNLDLVVTGNSDVSVLLGNGDGTLADAGVVNVIDPAGGDWLSSVAVGDFDGDDMLDLGVVSITSVFGGYDYDGYPIYYNVSSLHVLVGHGDGTFSAPSTTSLGGGYHTAAAAADFSGDGIDDLATTAPDNPWISVVLGDSSGVFQGPTHYHTHAGLLALAVADVDGDLDTDLVVAGHSEVAVLLGDGAGGFADAQYYWVLNPAVGPDPVPVSVAVADFNGDGALDVAITTNKYPNYIGQIDVFLGYGDGTFAYTINQSLDGGLYADALAVDDFDGDGLPDVAVTTLQGGAFLNVLTNAGGWVFPPTLAIGDVTVTEGDGGTREAVFTVTRRENLDTTATVSYFTANGGALAGSDYYAASGTLTFAPGETSKTISVQIIGDLTDEYDERFSVYLSNSTGASIADRQGICTIQDNDPPPTVTITPAVSGKEGGTNSTAFPFVVTLSAPSEKEVRVSYATADGTATTGDGDYVARSGTLTFAPGETSKTITVAVLGDQKVEPDETFAVKLSGATNATIGDGTGIGTIVNDDTSVVPSISISDVSKAEGRGGNTLFTFTVTLSAPSTTVVTVNYSTASGTAAGSDYEAAAGTLTFAPGETTKTITIKVKGDRTKEADETFLVNLFGVSSNATILDAQGIGTILNDD